MRPDADLSPHGLAQLIAGLLDALDLHDVTLVGNDTGGALCQLVVARHPERVGRLVLTDCDAFENFPPKAFRGLVWAARAHLLTAALQPLRLRTAPPPAVRVRPAHPAPAPRRAARGLGAAVPEPTPACAATRASCSPASTAAALLDNAARLAEFDRPVLLAWASGDPFFPIEHARRLAAIFPDARVAEIRRRAGVRELGPAGPPRRAGARVRAGVRRGGVVCGAWRRW